MSDFIILTDATLDLPEEIIQKWKIEVIPMPFHVDGTSYLHYPDERELSGKEFYQALRSGATATTAQIIPSVFESEFRKYLEQGKDVLCISFSSGLSGTYQSACIALQNVIDDYPKQKILCVDSLCASIGLGMLLFYVSKLREEGKTIEETAKWIEQHRYHIRHWFCVEDLNHLKKGGRVTAVEAVIGSALKIKPVLSMDREGHLSLVAKARGNKKALSFLISKLKEEGKEKEEVVIVGHADALETAEQVKQKIVEENLAKEVLISNIGPIIGTHVGPGMVALSFYGTSNIE